MLLWLGLNVVDRLGAERVKDLSNLVHLLCRVSDLLRFIDVLVQQRDCELSALRVLLRLWLRLVQHDWS